MKNQNTQKPAPDDLPAFVEKYFSHLQFAPHVPKEFQTFLKGQLNAFALTMRAQYRPPIMVAESAIEDIEAFENKFSVCNAGAIRIVPLEPLNKDLIQSLKDMIPLAAEYAGTNDQTKLAREKWLKARMVLQRAEQNPLAHEPDKTFDQVFEEEMTARGGA